MTVWLVGMMGSGKTSAGQLAAERLGVEFYDTDRVVAERMGCSVAQMWGRLGEAAFRDLETVVTSSLAGKEAIVATGGGVVLDPRNRRTMADTGPVVWLKARPSVLAERIGPDPGRPLLSDTGREETLVAHLSERADLYAEVATLEIDTDQLSLSEVAEAIVGAWNG